MDAHPLIDAITAFLAYFVGGAGFILLFGLIYLRVTPYAEIRLIRTGNVAAAISLGGALVGYTLPVVRAIEQAVGAVDFAVWAAVALVVQLAVFGAVRALLPELGQQIERDRRSEAVLLATVSIVAGLLNAACMTE